MLFEKWMMVTTQTDKLMHNKMFWTNDNFGIVIADVYFGANVKILAF